MKPELFYGTVYCGTPFQHCVNILGPLKRGDALIRNREILSHAANFSMRSSFVFLPESGECFINRRTNERYTLDFFDYKTWLDYGLSPCVSDVGERPPQENSQVDNALDGAQEAKNTVLTPPNVVELHMQQAPPRGARSPKLKHNREEAIEYLKQTLAETVQFKRELLLQDDQTPLVHPPLALVYATNSPTVRGALVEDMEDIKNWNWWDFAYGPGDGVVLGKSAQLPKGFASVARVRVQKDIYS
jgi:hypothetical protein